MLVWQAPKYLGGRNDTTYKVVCDNCDQTMATYSPNQLSNFSETRCVISGLMPQTSYRFTVFALNGVSGYDKAQSAEVLVQTGNSITQQSSIITAGKRKFLLHDYTIILFTIYSGHCCFLSWSSSRWLAGWLDGDLGGKSGPR